MLPLPRTPVVDMHEGDSVQQTRIEYLEPERRHVAVCSLTPEWSRAPAVPEHPLRGVFEWPDENPGTPEGPLVPPGLLYHRPEPSGGRADPIWDTAFSTKRVYDTPIEEDPPLLVPKGTQARALHSFFVRAGEYDRLAEIKFLADTQHQELATTLQEMKANGMNGYTLSSTPDGMDAANIAEGEVAPTLTEEEAKNVPPICNPRFVNAMQRRIDWERWVVYGQGPLTTLSFVKTPQGTLGIVYNGPEKDVNIITSLKREFARQTVARLGALPDPDDILDAKRFAAHYRKPVLALMTDGQWQEHQNSKKFGTEDHDPFRVEFHGDLDPKPQRDQYSWDPCSCPMKIVDNTPIIEHFGCVTHGWDDYNEDIAIWERRQTDRGYGGPSGMLGLDDAAPVDDDDYDSLFGFSQMAV